MGITRRTDYAIRLVCALIEAEGEPLSVRKVAEQYHVPYSFARSIQHDLSNAGIIESRRGAQGGMLLKEDADDLTLLDIIEVMEGPLAMGVCTQEKDWCPRQTYCGLHHIWVGADLLMRDYLSSVNIKDLLQGQKIPKISDDFAQEDAFSKNNIIEMAKVAQAK